MTGNLLGIKISSKRIYGLDILRALAILFVVFEHGEQFLPGRLRIYHDILIFDGVSIFFVLSGFLIGGILIKIIENNPPSIKTLLNFWTRRWFRTLPNYYLILFLIIIGYELTSNNFTTSEVKSYFIFSQNLFREHPGFFPEAWSLSIEEWFYLIIPICIFSLIGVIKLKPKKSILYALIMILIFSTLIRIYRYSILEISSYDNWDLIFRKQVATRLDSLMFGVLGAYFQFYNPKYWKYLKTPLLIIAIMIFIIQKGLYLLGVIEFQSIYNCVFSFSVTSIATLLLLPALSNLRTGKGLIFELFTVISLISYSMYLINFTIVQNFIIRPVPWNALSGNTYLLVILKYCFFWISTITGSILIYKYYELPMMAIRDKKWFTSMFSTDPKS